MESFREEKNFEINFLKIARIIWKRKYQIVILSSLIAVFNVFYALSLTNVYTSEAELAPNENTETSLGAFDRIGGIASLAGISTNIGNETNNYNLTIRSITSKQFLGEFIDKRDLYADIFAISSYDIETDKSYYDETIYIEKTSSWIRKIKKPYKPKPSVYEVREVLLENLTITKDSKMGLLYLTYTHPNPNFAKELLEMLINDINLYMQKRDIEFYSRVSKSLRDEIAKTEDKNLIDSLYSLIEVNQRKLAVAEASTEYALKIIDKPVTPEGRTFPVRSTLVITLSLLGGIFSTIIFVIHDYLKSFGYRRIFDLIQKEN